jgi:hypothetical protein
VRGRLRTRRLRLRKNQLRSSKEPAEVDDPDGIEVEFVYKNKTYYKDPSTNKYITTI